MDSTIQKKTNKLTWVVFGLSIALILVFVIAVATYIIVNNTTQDVTHQINIINNCNRDINLVIQSGSTILPTKRIATKQKETIYVTPGTYLEVSGYYDGTLYDPNQQNTFTKVKLWLAKNNYTRPRQINIGGMITNLDTPETTNIEEDVYSVSLQDGFNIPIRITSSNITDPSSQYLCNGPTWLNNEPTGHHLRDLCPNCMIYENDEPEFRCKTDDDTPTKYTITFCPFTIPDINRNSLLEAQ